jgi:cell division protein FtsI/penicillin-binding protein 2
LTSRDGSRLTNRVDAPRPDRFCARSACVLGALLLILAALGARSAQTASRDPQGAEGRALRQQRRILPQPGRPGSILARVGDGLIVLAGSRQAPNCYADPALVRDRRIDDISLRVGGTLGISPLEVQETLMLRRDHRFAYLKRDLASEEAQAVQSLRLPGVGIVQEWRRVYPCGDLASTVVGFRYRDGQPGGGLELSQEKRLTAHDGRRVVLTDAARRPIRLCEDEARLPRDGDNVLLCIDAVIQGYLQEAVAQAVAAHEARWATGVVVDPQTGEILAMCSSPSFDPAGFGEVSPERRLCRAVSVPYEPGSVMKPIFAAAAVDLGRMSYQSVIDCENGTYIARKGGRIRDSHPCGKLSLADVVVQSSNVGMAKVGEAMGNPRLHAVAEAFGFGTRTGIDLPGESPGIVRPLKGSKHPPMRPWDGYSMRRVPFGQEISVTAIQLAMAFSSLANGGELLQPRLVDRVYSPEGAMLWEGKRRVVRRVLSPRVAREALAVLGDVVERGTGRKCRLENWTSFGKTGTAQIPGKGGYVENAYVGSFVGGAPTTSPRALCLISVYWPEVGKGYYGGTVAAPYVRDVLRKTMVYLDVPPDKAGASSGLALGRGR